MFLETSVKSIIKFRVDGYYEWVAVTNGRINNFRPPVATNLSRTAPWFGKGCILRPTVRGGWERLRFKPHCSRGWAKCVLSGTVRGFWSRSRNQIPSKTIVKTWPKTSRFQHVFIICDLNLTVRGPIASCSLGQNPGIESHPKPPSKHAQNV